MAKTKIVDEGVETPNVEETNTMEQENPTPETPARPANEVKEPGVRKVKIRTHERVHCYVANVPYSLEKDTTYNVPADVAAILVNSGKAFRI